MHGSTHVYDRMCKKSDDFFNYGGGSEFFGHPLEEQTSRIENGLKKHDIECGYYVGGMKPQGLRDAQEKNVILGTFSMASEGMDIPKLNTMILASPKSDIVQSVGRILRQKKETRMFVPLIVDINDEFSTFKNQSKKRLVYYNRCKYDINIYDLDGTNYKYTKKKKKEYQRRLHRDLASKQKINANNIVKRNVKIRDTFLKLGFSNQNAVKFTRVKVNKHRYETLINRFGAFAFVRPYHYRYIAYINNH